VYIWASLGIARYLAISEHICAYLAISGGIWPYLAASGHIWPHLAISGHIYPCLVIIWIYLVISGKTRPLYKTRPLEESILKTTLARQGPFVKHWDLSCYTRPLC